MSKADNRELSHEALSYANNGTYALASLIARAMLDLCGLTSGDSPMPATQNSQDSAADHADPVEAEFPPVPDEDGPHDVPDELVIEKTLPTTPVPGISTP